MDNYHHYHCSVRGYSHILKNTVCQDSSVSLEEDGILIAAISDGHGDRNCFRSHIGSSAACKIIGNALMAFAKALNKKNREEELFWERSADQLVSQLFNSFLMRWNNFLLEHAKKNPPTEEELAKLKPDMVNFYRSGRDPLHMYGCTLIAMLKTDRYLLLLQQGDGHCTVFHADGTIDQPIPWDSRCVGNVTTSLCDKDVSSSWRYHVIDLYQDPVMACYACSDGIEDSYETTDAVNAYLSMLTASYVEEGREHFLETLEPHLSGLSKIGSRDDISVACILNPSAVAPHAKRFQMEYECMTQKAKIHQAQMRLSSMERKTQYLTDQLTRKQAEYEQSKQNYEDIGSFISRLAQQVKEYRRKQAVMQEDSEQAQTELKQAQQEYEEYMALRQSYVDAEAEAQSKLLALQMELNQLPPVPVPVYPAEEDTPIYQAPDEDSELLCSLTEETAEQTAAPAEEPAEQSSPSESKGE